MDVVSVGNFILLNFKKSERIYLCIDALLDRVEADQGLVLTKSVFQYSQFKRSNSVKAQVKVKQSGVLLQTLPQFPDNSLAGSYKFTQGLLYLYFLVRA